MLILLANMVARRERHSPKWCRERGVGRTRAILDEMPELKVEAIFAGGTTWAVSSEVQAAKDVLSSLCASCGLCELALPRPPHGL